MRSFNPQALMNSSRSQFQGLLEGLTGGQAHASSLLSGGAGFGFQQMSSLLTPASMVRGVASGTMLGGAAGAGHKSFFFALAAGLAAQPAGDGGERHLARELYHRPLPP